MAETDVGGIALPLDMDISGYSAKLRQAESQWDAFIKKTSTATASVRLPRPGISTPGVPSSVSVSTPLQVSNAHIRDLRTDINARFRQMASSGGAVSVPIKLGRIPYGQIRNEISAGIGEVPVRIAVGAIAPGSKNIIQALISQGTGVTMGKAQANIESAAASKGIPKKAEGGPVGPLMRRILEKQGVKVPETPAAGRPAEPFIPEWLRRGREGEGRAKDLTGKWRGGMTYHHAAAGGMAHGLYVVGEIGDEMFVPRRLEHLIPRDVMSQLPKRSEGGPTKIGQGGPQLWRAPEDGWIVPHRLMGRLAHMAEGGSTTGGGLLGSEAMAYTNPNAPRQPGVGRNPAARRRGPIPPGLGIDTPVSVTVVVPGQGGAAMPASGGPASMAREIAAKNASVTMSREDAMLNSLLKSAEARAAVGTEAVGRAYGRGAGTDPLIAETRRSYGAIRGLTPRSALAGAFGFELGGSSQRREALDQAAVFKRTFQTLSRELGNVDPIEHYQTEIKSSGRLVDDYRLKIAKLGPPTEKNAKLHATYATNLERAVQAQSRANVGLEHAEGLQRGYAEALQKAQLAPSGILRNFAAIQTATAAYQLALTGINFVMAAAGPAAGAVIDQLTGFPAISNRVTSALGQQLTAQHGNVDATFAQTAAMAGLSAESSKYIQSRLGPIAIAKAGAVTGTQTADLFRAGLGVGQTPQGLYGGYGGILGGPVAAGQLGGGAGLAEVIGDTLNLFQKKQASGQPYLNIPAVQNSPLQLPDNLKRFLSQPGGLYAGQAQGTIGPTPAEIAGAEQAVKDQQAYIDTFNDAAKRAATYLGQSADSAYKFAQITTEQANQIQASSLPDELKKIAQTGYGLETSQGQLLTTVGQTNKALLQMSQGLQITPAPVFAAQQAQALRAGTAAAGVRGEFERNVLIPGQFGQQRIANPFTPAATGINVSVLSAGTKSALSDIDALQMKLMADAKAAIATQAQVITQNLDPSAAAEFTSIMTGGADSVMGYGQQIAALNAQLANRQAQVGAQQYAFSLFQINRSLRDARGFLSGAGDSLGAIQRQQYDLQRESQRLQFAMQQREINFSVAVAGFQAPGITGQERAARITEAELVARYQQQQLNIGKQQYGLEGQATMIGATRSVIDLEKQRALISASYALSQEELATNRRIQVLGERQAQLQARAQSLFAQATGQFDARLGAAADYVANFSGSIKSATDAIRVAVGLAPIYSQGGTGGGGGGGAKRTQSGWLGMATMPTDLTIGEAGDETVAILRNPRRGQIGSGGGGIGGGSVQIIIPITITGNNIDSRMDVATIARQLTDEIETRLGRKGALLGIRAV